MTRYARSVVRRAEQDAYYSDATARQFGLRVLRRALTDEERDDVLLVGVLGHRIVTARGRDRLRTESSTWPDVTRAWREDPDARAYVRTTRGWRRVEVAP